MTPSPADLARYAECFAKNSAPRNQRVLDWQYATSPSGRVFADFALAPDGRVAAIYASLCVRLRIDGAVGLALQSIDTITDAEFRGRGLFVSLAQRTYARAAADGVELVYGFPNANSAHGFFRRLEWTQLDPVPFLIRPLRTSYALRQLKLDRYAERLPDLPLFLGRRSARGIQAIERFDERATALWQAFAAQVGVAVERDADYLNWRLVAKPDEAYRHLAVLDGERMLALVSYAIKDKHGGRIGYVMESLCLPGHERALRRLLRAALAEMVHERADVALAWCMSHSPTFGSLVRTGFLPFPERYRPIELHFGARGFAPAHAATVADRRRWYLSYLDSDTV